MLGTITRQFQSEGGLKTWFASLLKSELMKSTIVLQGLTLSLSRQALV
jgi:hypothetical protein